MNQVKLIVEEGDWEMKISLRIGNTEFYIPTWKEHSPYDKGMTIGLLVGAWIGFWIAITIIFVW